jgi:hypothetical protein
MGDREIAQTDSKLDALHTVCGAIDSKPAEGGRVKANPGYADCGYLGWLTTSSATALALRHRFAADPRRRRSA